jgi:hypothetical protein
MEGIIQKILQTEPTVLQRIAVKQEYRRETLGAEAADVACNASPSTGFVGF